MTCTDEDTATCITCIMVLFDVLNISGLLKTDEGDLLPTYDKGPCFKLDPTHDKCPLSGKFSF